MKKTSSMERDVVTVLFLCTGNSARSIMAEALLNHHGAGRFRAYSAGSIPAGVVNPLALKTLQRRGLPTQGLRSKSWDEFTEPRAPQFDFVITLCDRAAGETCPVWPGRPISAHWGIDDPAACAGDDRQKARAFAEACRKLENRIKLFADLLREGPGAAARGKPIGTGETTREGK